MVIGQTVRLLVEKANTSKGRIGMIVHIYRNNVYEVEFKSGLNHTSETCTQDEIEKL